MARKRDFKVNLKQPGKKDKVFKGKNCEVTGKSLAAKLQIENPYKETIECEKYTIEDAEEKVKKKEKK